MCLWLSKASQFTPRLLSDAEARPFYHFPLWAVRIQKCSNGSSIESNDEDARMLKGFSIRPFLPRDHHLSLIVVSILLIQGLHSSLSLTACSTIIWVNAVKVIDVDFVTSWTILCTWSFKVVALATRKPFTNLSCHQHYFQLLLNFECGTTVLDCMRG